MGFILMYDITNEESFNAVQDWYVCPHPPSSEPGFVQSLGYRLRWESPSPLAEM